MTFISEHLIPGNHGKVFSTDARKPADLERIRRKLTSLDGIEEVYLDTRHPTGEFRVRTSRLLGIGVVEEAVNQLGFHAVPKGLFEDLWDRGDAEDAEELGSW